MEEQEEGEVDETALDGHPSRQTYLRSDIIGELQGLHPSTLVGVVG